MKKAVIAVLVIAVLGGGAFALSQNNDDKKETDSTSSVRTETTTKSNNGSESSETSVTTNNGQSEVTITYSNSGFSADNINVNAGAKITVKNTSSRTLDFASDEHPTHEINSELNVGEIAPGESKTFTVNRKGTFGFHDHLNPGDTGTIIVK